jgi:hypothetical protein
MSLAGGMVWHMSTPRQCQVQGCGDRAEAIFDAGKGIGIPIQWGVCTFHSTALNNGEPYALGDNQQEIILGVGVPLELMTWNISMDISGSTVTLIFGRDGVEEHRLPVRLTAERAQELADDVKDWA